MTTALSLDTALLRGPTHLARTFMRLFVRPGDHVVDATCGAGRDTLLLAQLVGPRGRVWAFDIQDEALRATAERLKKSGLSNCAELIAAGHERMADYVPKSVRMVVFNLGYCPGGNRTVITVPETTMPAVEQALRLLMPEGVLALTVYPGHSGGLEESAAIFDWLSSLDQRLFHAWRMEQVNTDTNAPYFFLIQKAA